MLADSGDIYDTRITGGRVGVYQFGQQMSLFSNINVYCIDRQNMAMKFNGIDNYVSITNVTQLKIDKRYVNMGLCSKSVSQHDQKGQLMRCFSESTNNVIL